MTVRRKIGKLLPGISLYRAPRRDGLLAPTGRAPRSHRGGFRFAPERSTTGMTGEVPDAPRKRRRAGSIPAFSTGGEGDGNPLALGARKTRFDSGVSDHGSLAETD
jgi:hypothetical protein